jgi:hypothetical protein
MRVLWPVGQGLEKWEDSGFSGDVAFPNIDNLVIWLGIAV